MRAGEYTPPTLLLVAAMACGCSKNSGADTYVNPDCAVSYSPGATGTQSLDGSDPLPQFSCETVPPACTGDLTCECIGCAECSCSGSGGVTCAYDAGTFTVECVNE